MSIRRVNRFEQERGFITAQGIKRVARARDVSGLDAQVSQQVKQKPLKSLDQVEHRLLVVLHTKAGEVSTLDREVMYVARLWPNSRRTEVHLGFGQPNEGLSWVDYEFDRLHLMTDEVFDHYVPQAKAAAVSALYRELNAQRVLFGESELGDSVGPLTVREGLALVASCTR